MVKLLNQCPLCGSKLQYNNLMQYAIVYNVKKNGELSKNGKKEDCGAMESGFLSCINEDCTFATNCDLEYEKDHNLKIWQQGNKYYYEIQEED